MILCLDSGNTRLKWGLYEGTQARTQTWLARGVVAQNSLAELVAQLAPWPQPAQLVGCNVAGAGQAAAISALLGQPVTWISASAGAGGVKNLYAQPAQLGADRWAALIAVRVQHAGAALVVSAGTATTIDMLNEAGEFCGGVILPGLFLMRESLARNTAQLPLTDADYAEWPRDTDSAIASGTLEAQVGAIERLFARVSGDNKHCFVTGGTAPMIAPLLSVPHTVADDLVLRGVQCLAQAL